MKREQVHDPKAEGGVEVKPTKQVCPETGWLVREEDPRDNKYDGENAPWRQT
jgi:hypothetical protein